MRHDTDWSISGVSMTLLRAVATVGFLTMISRILGFLRDVLIAGLLGAGVVTDAFVIALLVPNMFRRLFGEGAFSACFVPVFTRTLTQQGRSSAEIFARECMGMLALLLAVLVFVLEIAMPVVIDVLASGFASGGTRRALAIDYGRMTAPYLLFICLVAAHGGILNGLGHYAAFATAPILFNISLIVALLLAGWQGEAAPAMIGRSLVIAVLVSGIVQLVWMVVCCWRRGFTVWPRLRMPDRLMRHFLVLMPPALLIQGTMQLQLLMGASLASRLPTGAVSYLYYADRVVQLPLGVVGVALASVLLPRLARDVAEQRDSKELNRACEMALLVGIPMGFGLAALAGPVIAVLFERGSFSPAETSPTSHALVAYAVGLPAFLLVRILSAPFFAREDMRLPLYATILALAVYVMVALIGAPAYGHVALALATSVAIWLQSAVLGFVLIRRGWFRPERGSFFSLLMMVASAAVMYVVVSWLSGVLGQGGMVGEWWRALRLLVLVGCGFVVYVSLGWVFRFPALREIRTLWRKRRNDAQL